MGADEGAGADGAAGVEPLWELPESGELPEGVIVGTLDGAEHRELIERHLGSLVSGDDDVFVALNEAGVRAGAFVYVPRGVALTEPISLRSVQARTGTLLNQRTLVVLEEGAQAEVWEQFLSGAGDLDGVFNTVTELVVGQATRGFATCAARGCPRTAGSSGPSAPRSAAMRRSTGSRSGSARRAATCGWRRGSPAREPRRA